MIKTQKNQHDNGPDMLYLHDHYYLGEEKYAALYQHPKRYGLLVKIMKPKQKYVARGKNSDKLFWLVNRYRLVNPYVRELVELVRFRSVENYYSDTFIQKNIGFVITNLGLGMIVKAEVDHDGNYARTLESYLVKKEFNQYMRERLDEFFNQMLASNLTITDLHPRNIVYAYNVIYDDHFVLVDGIGDKTIIPLRWMSLSLRNRAKLRAIKKCRSMISEALYAVDK